MDRKVGSILSAVALSTLVCGSPAKASWYALVIGAQGSHQAVFAGDVTAVAAALTNGRWTGYDVAGHTRTLCAAGCPAVASSANVAAGLAAINALMAADPDRNKHLLFYFAGHGDNSDLAFAPAGANAGERVPPALNRFDEFLAYNVDIPNRIVHDHVYDDALPGVLAANVPNATDFLYIIDSCHSGGLWNGMDPPGDLEAVANGFMIASTPEGEDAPMNSLLRAKFVNVLQNRRKSFTGKQMARAVGYQNLSFTGLRRQVSEGHPFVDYVIDAPLNSFDIGDNEDGLFFQISDRFGSSSSSCDFDGDGFQDLAVGVPNEDVGTIDSVVDAGAVNVLYGSPAGLSGDGGQVWSQDTPGIQGSAEEGDAFGEALTCSDINSDGFADLVIGIPGEDVGAIVDAGAVQILYGSPSGLSSGYNQVWDQNKAGVEGASEEGDAFGAALNVGDFNGDGFADIASGVPGEDVGAIIDAGAVNVLYGTPNRLSVSGDQLWDQNVSSIEDAAEAGDAFGTALAANDFNGDGFADLAIGVPGEDAGSLVDAGAVSILYGGRIGLGTANDQVWSQNSPNIEGASSNGDQFGAALTTGDFDHDGFADLAIGVPGEDVGGIIDAGAVNVLYGSATRLQSQGDQIWHQNRSNVEDTSETRDGFGRALASGDFDHDGFSDLAIGVPSEDVGAAVDAGAVQILYGSGSRLSAGRDEVWSQSRAGVQDSSEIGDQFGTSVQNGDFNGDGFADLAIGVPSEDVGTTVDAGAINILYGASGGLSAADNQLWSQASGGLDEEPE